MLGNKSSWGTIKNKAQDEQNNYQQEKQSLNIWETQTEAFELIPDMDEQIKQKQQNDKKLSAPSMGNQKMASLKELEVETKKYSLPQKEVELQQLLKHIRPYDEVIESDDLWEFSTLKSEIYQIVNIFK